MPRKTAEDLTGQVFGRLTAISFHSKNTHRQSLWLCRCECGTEKIILAPSLKTGATVSCGCRNIESIRERRTKHGKAKHGSERSSTYISWASMMSRCTNPNATNYDHYGGRGIKVCERWHDFANFHADMGDRPKGKYSLDRIDPNGHYEPSNCRWVNSHTQARNKRAAEYSKSKITGVTWNKPRQKWQVRISHKGIQYHLGLFDDLKEAKRVRKEAESTYDKL